MRQRELIRRMDAFKVYLPNRAVVLRRLDEGHTPEWRPPPAAMACVGAHAGVGFYVYPDKKKDINDDRGWHTAGQ